MLLFGSWCPGIENDPAALRFIQQNTLLDDIELSGFGDALDRVQAAGLTANLHNAVRWGVPNVDERAFLRDNFPYGDASHLVLRARTAQGPTIGFHLPRSIPIASRSETLQRAFEHITWLEAVFPGHTIVVEAPPVYTRGSSNERLTAPYMLPAHDLPTASVDLLFEIDQRLQDSSAGHLVDVGHLLVAIEQTERPGTYAELLESFHARIRQIAPRIRQVHLNAPTGNLEEGLFDAHEPLSQGQHAPLVVAALNLLLREMESQGVRESLKALTIEIDTDGTPQEHVRVLKADAEIVKRILG